MQCLESYNEVQVLKTSGLKWALSELGPSLREFALKDFQQWIAGLAGSSLTSVFDHYQKFLTGICTNTAADVQDFINRENIPKGSRLEVPKGFDLPAFMATYANDPSAELSLPAARSTFRHVADVPSTLRRLMLSCHVPSNCQRRCHLRPWAKRLRTHPISQKP